MTGEAFNTTDFGSLRSVRQTTTLYYVSLYPGLDMDTGRGDLLLGVALRWPRISSRVSWENSGHFAMPLLLPSWNDILGTNAEIPYWCCVATQISIVLLIGQRKFSTRGDQSEVLHRSVITSNQCRISALVPQTLFCRYTSEGVARRRLFFSSYIHVGRSNAPRCFVL